MTLLLVGAGPMALAYAKVLAGMGIAYDSVGRGEASAAAFAAETGVRAHTGGLDAYLAARTLTPGTVAIVALPIPALAEATERLIAAGAGRILVEKPAGLTPEEIDSVAKTAGDAKVPVFVAYNRRFYASVEAARR